MPRIGPLLAQPTVLQRDQIHKQRWMLVNQGEKAGAVQPNQSGGVNAFVSLLWR